MQYVHADTCTDYTQPWPTGNTRPLNVTSPVMAVSERVQRPLKRDANTVTTVTPADGPSFPTAPAGKWTCTSVVPGWSHTIPYWGTMRFRPHVTNTATMYTFTKLQHQATLMITQPVCIWHFLYMHGCEGSATSHVTSQITFIKLKITKCDHLIMSKLKQHCLSTCLALSLIWQRIYFHPIKHTYHCCIWSEPVQGYEGGFLHHIT